MQSTVLDCLICSSRVVSIAFSNLGCIFLFLTSLQAVETVGQAGKPKTITGFQTHKVRVCVGVVDLEFMS